MNDKNIRNDYKINKKNSGFSFSPKVQLHPHLTRPANDTPVRLCRLPILWRDNQGGSAACCRIVASSGGRPIRVFTLELAIGVSATSLKRMQRGVDDAVLAVLE